MKKQSTTVHRFTGERNSRANRGLLLRTLRDLGQASRTDLARHTGLQPSTVSTLTRDFLQRGLVEEVASRAASSRGGRRQVLLALRGGHPIAMGLHLGVRKVAIALVDQRGNLLSDSKMPRPAQASPIEISDMATRRAHELLAERNDACSSLLGVGVTIPAPVDAQAGVVLAGRDLGWTDNVELRRLLTDRLHLPVTLDTSPHGQLLAERSFGSLKGIDDALLVAVATTIRVSLLQRGEIHSPTPHFAGSLGHSPSIRRGAVCRCGAEDCLNVVAGRDALGEQGRSEFGSQIDVEDIYDLATRGDNQARAIVRQSAHQIAEALLPLLLLYEPKKVVVAVTTEDSLLSMEIGEYLRAQHAARLRNRLPDVVPAALTGNMAVGAACLPLHEHLF